MLNTRVTPCIKYITHTNLFLLALNVSLFRDSLNQEQVSQQHRARCSPGDPPSLPHHAAKGCAETDNILLMARQHQHANAAI